jgi:RNA polymerase sigma-70 factor (ECF subfamily)
VVPDGVGEYARRLIREKAKGLIGRYGFTKSDREDLEQELTLDLLRRLPDYDPERARRTTFSARVVEHRIASIIEHREAARRDWRRCRRSLNEPIENQDGESAELGETFDADGRTRADLSELRLDLAGVLDGLPEQLRQVCRETMAGRTPLELARDFGVDRRTITRWKAQLRQRFRDAGLDAYL